MTADERATPEPGIVLTEAAEARAPRALDRHRARRSACWCVLFYVVTIVKGPGVLVRPL